MEVLVFSTSVETEKNVSDLKPFLDALAGEGHWNFALDDCDHVLRIVSRDLCPQAAIQLLTECGFQCRELEN